MSDKYQVFAVFGQHCWRSVLPPIEYQDLQEACRAADARVSSLWWRYAVSTEQDGPILYLTKGTFEGVAQNNPIVREAMKAGMSLEGIIVELDHAYYLAIEQLRQLSTICPTRVRHPDGRELVWHCPDALIPLTDLSNTESPCLSPT